MAALFFTQLKWWISKYLPYQISRFYLFVPKSVIEYKLLINLGQAEKSSGNVAHENGEQMKKEEHRTLNKNSDNGGFQKTHPTGKTKKGGLFRIRLFLI